MNGLTVNLVPKDRWQAYLPITKDWYDHAEKQLQLRKQSLPASLEEIHRLYTFEQRIDSCMSRCEDIYNNLIKNQFSPRWEFYIAQKTSDGTLHGMMLITLPESFSLNLEIKELTTHPANIDSPDGQKGVGKALVEQSFKRAIEVDAGKVFVTSASSSISFYSHVGFEYETYSCLRLSRKQILARQVPPSPKAEDSNDLAREEAS